MSFLSFHQCPEVIKSNSNQNILGWSPTNYKHDCMSRLRVLWMLGFCAYVAMLIPSCIWMDWLKALIRSAKHWTKLAARLLFWWNLIGLSSQNSNLLTCGMFLLLLKELVIIIIIIFWMKWVDKIMLEWRKSLLCLSCSNYSNICSTVAGSFIGVNFL